MLSTSGNPSSRRHHFPSFLDHDVSFSSRSPLDAGKALSFQTPEVQVHSSWMWTEDGDDPYDDPLVLKPDRLDPVDIKSHDRPDTPSPSPEAPVRSRHGQSVSKATQHLLVNLTNGNHPEVEAEGAAIVPFQELVDEIEKLETSASLGLKADPPNNYSPPLGRREPTRRSMQHRTGDSKLSSQESSMSGTQASGLNIWSSEHALLDSDHHYVLSELAAGKNPHFRALRAGKTFPPTGKANSQLSWSSVRPHILLDAPTPEHILPSINTEVLPTSRGPLSPNRTTLPSITPLIESTRDISISGSRIQQRQRSSSILSSVSATSPDYALSSAGSPLARLGLSPTFSQEDALSPRESGNRASSHATMSPTFATNSSALRRLEHDTDFYPSSYQAGAGYERQSSTSTAASPETSINTALTTPSDTSTVNRGQSAHDMPSLRHAPNSGLGRMPPPSGSAGVHSARGPRSPIYLRHDNSVQMPPSSYQRDPRSPISANQPPSSNQYKCDFTGCDAPPFHTQYLLNSHKTVHSESRPHYCSIEGCSRSVIGQGFKRKNEMIRHQLVHESPGYICPYCPTREHKYPRPDNLQRHVKAHHTDVPITDAKLRAVLDRKHNGRSTVRKKKMTTTQ